jgi:hypothetical protein
MGILRPWHLLVLVCIALVTVTVVLAVALIRRGR